MAGPVRCWVWLGGRWRTGTRLEPDAGLSLVRVLVDGIKPSQLFHPADVRSTEPPPDGPLSL
jgi:hypothetical protein